MSIGSKLIELRNKKGLTRVQMAEELNIPHTTLRNYETDAREPGHKFLLEVSRYFGVTTDYILENEKSPAPEGTEEKRFTVDDMKFLLNYLGYGDNIEDISDKDFAFLSGIFDLLEAWFG